MAGAERTAKRLEYGPNAQGKHGKCDENLHERKGALFAISERHVLHPVRARAGLNQVRVHDLRHTFGQRLRAAGVSLEDRKALLGHKSGDVTTDYSALELAKIIEYVERLCQERPNTVLRLATPAKVPQKIPKNAKVFTELLTA